MLPDPLVSEVFERRPRSSRGIGLIVAVSFAIVGITWVILTDIIVYLVTTDRVLLARLQTMKDWLFVVLASVVLYFVARIAASRLSRAHALLVAVVESIGDGILVVGPERKILHANRAAQDMLGSKDGKDLVGLGGVEFAQKFKVSKLDGTLVRPDRFVSQRVFDEPIPQHTKEVLYPPNRNRALVILATGAPVVTRPGEPIQLVVSVMHDVTDIEQFEAMRDQFISAAAHYLKTPVAIVKANVQHLTRIAPNPEQGSLAMIQRQCERIDRLVQNLLVLARARSHSLELHARDMELAPLVRAMARDLNDDHNPHEIQITIGALPHVRGDQERLAIVTRNLSQDALQHSVPRSVIRVNLGVEGPEAELRVSYKPLPVSARTFAGALEYDDTTLSRCVTETIVQAHGGHIGEVIDDKEVSVWVTLPVVGGTA